MTTAQQNFTLMGDPLSLDRIRSILTRLEDTIIFGLIERAQFAHNPKMYRRGGFTELNESGFQGSWLEWFLRETESFHGMLTYFSMGCCNYRRWNDARQPRHVDSQGKILFLS